MGATGGACGTNAGAGAAAGSSNAPGFGADVRLGFLRLEPPVSTCAVTRSGFCAVTRSGLTSKFVDLS